MKTKKFKLFAGSSVAAITIVVALLGSCKKEDLVTPVESTSKTTGLVIDASVGATSTNVSGANQYYLDKAHCNVMWESKYYAENAMLTGRFNWFDMFVKFDFDNPANSSVKAKVQLSTFNTGEPGRDAYTRTPYKVGCGMTYMGVKFDTTATTITPQALTDTAYFTSTACKKYGDGYIVTGNFVFRGVTKSVDMYTTATDVHTTVSATTGKSSNRVGFHGEFKINQKDFSVNSTSIADEVTIVANCNVRTKDY